MPYSQDQIDAINEVADHQMRGETLEHALAAAHEHYQDAQHRNDGADDGSQDSHCDDVNCV